MGRLSVHTDLQMARSVSTTFLTNAFKFVPEGRRQSEEGGLVKLSVQATDDGEGLLSYEELVARVTQNDTIPLRISVEDNGVGIPEELLPSVFEAGKQLRKGELQGGGGSGFGLW